LSETRRGDGDAGYGADGLGDGTDNRRQIPAAYLAAAAKLFRHKGFGAATTREIASAVGVQKSTLYHYIDSKEELLLRLSQDAISEVLSGASAVMATDDPPVDRLRHIIRLHLEAVLDRTDEHMTQLIELRSLPPTYREEIVTLRDGYESIVVDCVRECQDAGDIERDLSPRMLVLALMGLLNWSIFWFRSDGTLTVQQLSEILTRIFLFGVTDRINEPPPIST